jgi:hypothetical protein
MANPVLTKALTESLYHLRCCKKEVTPEAPCVECVKACGFVASALSDSIEVANYLRNLTNKYASMLASPPKPPGM